MSQCLPSPASLRPYVPTPPPDASIERTADGTPCLPLSDPPLA